MQRPRGLDLLGPVARDDGAGDMSCPLLTRQIFPHFPPTLFTLCGFIHMGCGRIQVSEFYKSSMAIPRA